MILLFKSYGFDIIIKNTHSKMEVMVPEISVRAKPLSKREKIDIEEIITYILKNNNFISNNSTLFIGGNSQSKLDLVQKYNLGINQWMGSDSDFIDKQNIYKNLINPIGTLSRCVTNKKIYVFDYEKIFVVKDSNLKIFKKL